MVLSTSQQVALAFTAVLFTFVVLPRMLGVGGGAGTKDTRMDPRYSRKGPGPAGVRGQAVHGSGPSPENMQQMKKLMEQEMKNSDKFKSNSNNKGYVFTLMPLYAIGVGVFAAYKFLKIKSADDQAQKDKLTKGAKKSAEAENQLNELEQRLAQTERMLNSILTQLDPLTNCVKTVAQEQKTEIMSQLQTIRYLMKKRGMDCPPLNLNEASCERNLDNLIESLGASEYTLSDGETPGPAEEMEKIYQTHSDATEEDEEEMKELVPEDCDQEVEPKDVLDEQQKEEEEEEDCELMPSLEDSCETDTEKVFDASGLRRRHKPE